jgi:chitinase
VVTYDDPESLGLKAAFARRAGILGLNMFDAHGDTTQWDLIDAIRGGLGLI